MATSYTGLLVIVSFRPPSSPAFTRSRLAAALAGRRYIKQNRGDGGDAPSMVTQRVGGGGICLQPVSLFASSPLVSFIAIQPEITPPKSEHSAAII